MVMLLVRRKDQVTKSRGRVLKMDFIDSRDQGLTVQADTTNCCGVDEGPGQTYGRA